MIACMLAYLLVSLTPYVMFIGRPTTVCYSYYVGLIFRKITHNAAGSQAYW